MKWFVLVLLLLVGCGDTIIDPCGSQANIPPKPHADAYRSMQTDTLFWTWKVRVEPDKCHVLTEHWIWDGCTWHFEKLIKTVVDC